MVSAKFIFLLSLSGLATAATLGVGEMRFDWSQVDSLAPAVHLPDHHQPALAEANKQLTCMLNAIHWATTKNDPADKGQAMHKKYLAMVHEVFGNDAKVDVIKTWTQALAKTVLVIGMDNAPNAGSPGTFAMVDPTDRKVYIFELYHAATYLNIPIGPVARARVLLHEASHAFTHTTWDWWTIINGHVTPVNTPLLRLHQDAEAKKAAGQTLTTEEKSHILSPLVNGYWHAAYKTLRDAASLVMHENADTWAAFGYRCEYGRLPVGREDNADADPRSIIWTAP